MKNAHWTVSELRADIDRVRTRIIWLSLFFPIICIGLAVYSHLTHGSGVVSPVEQYPSLTTTIGHIMAFYLPILSVVLGFLYSDVPIPTKALAPHGTKMARTRDRFSTVLFSIVLGVPIIVYGVASIPQANNVVLGYHSMIQTVLAGGLLFYFGRTPTEADKPS